MANVSGPSSVELCIADITECSICNEVLQDNRCLPCLHTFCLKCLEAYKRGKPIEKTVACPVCRREFQTPISVADLPRNFFIDKLIDAHRRKQPDKPKICEICEGSKVVKATHYCCDCHQNLCSLCERQHKKIKATAKHRVVNNTKVTDKQRPSPRPTYCFVHTTKEAEVYCQECKMVICWRCKFFKHNSHTSIEFNNAARDLSKRLEEHIGEISEHVSNKHDAIQKLRELEKAYTAERDTESENICREINKLYRMIGENGDKLKKELTTSTTVHLNAIHSLIDKLETDASELKRHKIYIEQMIHLGNGSDLCEYTDKLIAETARKAASNSVEITIPAIPHLLDMDLQNLLIGKRADIDQQYTCKCSNCKEQPQDHLHPHKNSKDEGYTEKRNTTTETILHKIHFGISGGSKRKRKKSVSKIRATQYTSLDCIPTISNDNASKYHLKHASSEWDIKEEEETSDCEYMDTLERFDSVRYQSGRPVQSSSSTNFANFTQVTAVKPQGMQVLNQEELLPECKNWSLKRTLSLGDFGAICGLTILGSKLYAVFQNSNHIQVFDTAEFEFLTAIAIDGQAIPNDITSCKFNDCLYICDWVQTRIFRIKIKERMEQMSWSLDGDLGTLSVTADHNILLAGYLSSKIKEYTPNGGLIRTITLEDGFKPWHAVKLVSSDFLICQGDNSNAPHRVCLADSNGKLTTSFGGAMGFDEAHLCGPYHLAVNKSGEILVSDCNNSRILLLSRDLRFVKEAIPSSAKVLRRARRMCLDEVAGRLYLADNAATSDGATDGRIQIFSSSQLI